MCNKICTDSSLLLIISCLYFPYLITIYLVWSVDQKRTKTIFKKDTKLEILQSLWCGRRNITYKPVTMKIARNSVYMKIWFICVFASLSIEFDCMYFGNLVDLLGICMGLSLLCLLNKLWDISCSKCIAWTFPLCHLYNVEQILFSTPG